jgi:peptide chain release factor 3
VTEKVTVELDSVELDEKVGEQDAEKLREDLDLVSGVYPDFEVETYRSAEVAPVFFGSALNNFGVQELLDCFVEIAPSPKPTKAEEREVQPEEPKFTGFIFKSTSIEFIGSLAIVMLGVRRFTNRRKSPHFCSKVDDTPWIIADANLL